MRPSENRLRDSRKHECTFVVAWEQASWWGKGKTIVSRGEEAGEGRRTSPFPAISSLLLFG